MIHRLRQLSQRPGLWVLFSFVLLNTVLLLPYYIFNRTDGSILPIPGRDLNSWSELLISREHVDLLRINLEISVGLALWVNMAGFWRKKARTRYWRVFLVIYSLALVYKSYTGVLTGLYQMEPNFYNDSTFISKGLPYLLNALELPAWFLLVSLLGLLALFGGLYMGTRALLVHLPLEKSGWGARALLAGAALLTLVYSCFSPPVLSDPRNVVNSLAVEVASNVRYSLESRQKVAAFDVGSPFRAYDYTRYYLRQKPDIYLIFLESYGGVLYTKEHFKRPYLEFMRGFDDQIEAAGWSSVSIFSEAPIWGGGTWISYTSVMFGLQINEQKQYETVHTAYQRIPYPHMGRYFHNQGYEYVWVAPIQQRITPEREAADQGFFGADRWITLDSMNYHGPLYGWGPSPPDQYTFGVMGDFLRTQTQPTFLVFLTQNSHYPWTPLPHWASDWRSFAEIKSESDPLNQDLEKPHTFRASRQNYLNAMDYTIKALGEFITGLDDTSAIIVLIGDHQPPAVSYKGDGYSTMLHIISQDEDFLKGFKAEGFTDGLILDEPEGAFAHEGFYSLFIRGLIRRYGTTPQNLPPYLPNGLSFSQP